MTFWEDDVADDVSDDVDNDMDVHWWHECRRGKLHGMPQKCVRDTCYKRCVGKSILCVGKSCRCVGICFFCFWKKYGCVGKNVVICGY